jgi:prepilin-type N-terminal cleavage/methylation domain-containing protein
MKILTEKHKNAFTLLEAVIVIIIIGVLASLALPRLTEKIRCSQTTNMFSVISKLRREMEQCYLEKGSYSTCGRSNLNDWGPALTDYAGYCYTVAPEDDDPDNYYSILVFGDHDGDTDCDRADLITVRGDNLHIYYRSDINGVYKYYDLDGECYISINDDPDRKGSYTRTLIRT